MLQPGVNPFNGSFQKVSASLSQTGLVPDGTESLMFDAEIYAPFTVSLGGNPLTLVTLGTAVNGAGVPYAEYGANIANYAGQTEPLTVTVLAAPNSPNIFDAFSFSPIAVPEPSIWGLAALGGAFLACGILKKRAI